MPIIKDKNCWRAAPVVQQAAAGPAAAAAVGAAAAESRRQQSEQKHPQNNKKQQQQDLRSMSSIYSSLFGRISWGCYATTLFKRHKN